MTLGKAGRQRLRRRTASISRPTSSSAPNGDIFVTDSHRNGKNNRVVKFTKDGKFIKEWGKKGSGRGEISEPHTIAMDSRGRLFVGDRENNRIQIFDQDGNVPRRVAAVRPAERHLHHAGRHDLRRRLRVRSRYRRTRAHRASRRASASAARKTARSPRSSRTWNRPRPITPAPKASASTRKATSTAPSSAARCSNAMSGNPPMRTATHFVKFALILLSSAASSLVVRARRRQSDRPAERLQGSEVAQRRRDARRPRHRLLGRAPAAAHVLLRRRRRRRVEDGRCRHHVDADQRRADRDRIDRLDRRGAVESQSRLGRHRQRGDPLERDHRPRRLQVHRRRQDLAVHGPQGLRPDRRHQGPPLQHQHRVAGGARLAVRPERRARHLQDHRRAARPGRRRCS